MRPMSRRRPNLLPLALLPLLSVPGQVTAAQALQPPSTIDSAQVRLQPSLLPDPGTLALQARAHQPTTVFDLPDAPGWTLPPPPPPIPPCPAQASKGSPPPPTDTLNQRPCIQVNPFRRFLDATTPIPLTPRQKGYLAIHNLRDPANLITIAGTAAFTICFDSHTAYGPGWKGFARNTGYSFSQDATGEFFGTFLIPSLLHEDPHYHREPQASVPRRIVHAISRTVVAQHDDGTMMPNYAVLFTYPISAEISNLYVPGVSGDAASTARRIVTGLATDPISNIITEFLPDVAKRINIRVIFVQRILNTVAAESMGGPGAGVP